MKSLVLSSMLGLAAMVATASDGTLTGKWKIHSSIAGNDSDSECTLTQKGNELTGTCATDKGDQKASGKVDGSKAEWSFDSEYNGTALTIKYIGTMDSATSKMSGTVNVAPFDVDGDFTATLTQ